jgi:hypothetical protein
MDEWKVRGMVNNDDVPGTTHTYLDFGSFFASQIDNAKRSFPNRRSQLVSIHLVVSTLDCAVVMLMQSERASLTNDRLDPPTTSARLLISMMESVPVIRLRLARPCHCQTRKVAKCNRLMNRYPITVYDNFGLWKSGINNQPHRCC